MSAQEKFSGMFSSTILNLRIAGLPRSALLIPLHTYINCSSVSSPHVKLVLTYPMHFSFCFPGPNSFFLVFLICLCFNPSLLRSSSGILSHLPQCLFQTEFPLLLLACESPRVFHYQGAVRYLRVGIGVHLNPPPRQNFLWFH